MLPMFIEHRPLLQRHPLAAARGDIDDGIAAVPDLGQELCEHLRIGGGPSAHGVTRVKMHDRCPRLSRADRAVSDLLRRDRQVFRDRGDVDRAGHRAAHDHFSATSHLKISSVYSRVDA
jgi:hypothetical protein